EVDALVEADVDETFRFLDIRVAPALEELAFAPEGAGAEAQDGNLEAGMSECPVFHLAWSLREGRPANENAPALVCLPIGLDPRGGGSHANARDCVRCSDLPHRHRCSGCRDTPNGEGPANCAASDTFAACGATRPAAGDDQVRWQRPRSPREAVPRIL